MERQGCLCAGLPVGFESGAAADPPLLLLAWLGGEDEGFFDPGGYVTGAADRYACLLAFV